MIKIILFILFPFLGFSQTQIGSDIDGEAPSDFSGQSVSMSADGNIVAIGAPNNDGNGSNSGHVRVYKNTVDVWTQVGVDINGEAPDDAFGTSVSLSANGNTLAISAPNNNGSGNDSGHTRVYQNLSGVWTQIGTDINGEAAFDKSGNVSLSADGRVVAIGTPWNNNSNGNSAGHTRVYQNILGNWVKIGADIDGEAAYDYSGCSVSLSSDGSIVAIGAYSNDPNPFEPDSGHVRLYNNISGVWTQIGGDINGQASSLSGYSISLSSSGSIVAIGAIYGAANGYNSGHVSLYKNMSGTWTQIGTDIMGEAEGDLSGHSVSLSADGNIVAIGALYNDGNGTNSGQVRIYQNTFGTWTQMGVDIDGESAYEYSGEFGRVSLSPNGQVVAIGSYGNAGDDNYAGQVRVYGLSTILSSNSFVLSYFSIYPNPVSEIVTITLQNDLELKSINIYNSLGQFIKSENNPTIDVRKLSKGNYFFEVITNKGKATKTLLVK